MALVMTSNLQGNPSEVVCACANWKFYIWLLTGNLLVTWTVCASCKKCPNTSYCLRYT